MPLNKITYPQITNLITNVVINTMDLSPFNPFKYKDSVTIFFFPVDWGCRIHQLLLGRGAKPHQQVSWI